MLGEMRDPPHIQFPPTLIHACQGMSPRLSGCWYHLEFEHKEYHLALVPPTIREVSMGAWGQLSEIFMQFTAELNIITIVKRTTSLIVFTDVSFHCKVRFHIKIFLWKFPLFFLKYCFLLSLQFHILKYKHIKLKKKHF